MSIESVNWFSDKILEENKNASTNMYKFIEKEFTTCLEYVTLAEEHLPVYSFRFAHLITRIGPEVLRQFNIILFDRNRSAALHYEECIKPLLIELQKKCEARTDNFMDYFNLFPTVRSGGIDKIAVKIKPLDKYIVPFEVEVRKGVSGKPYTVVPWWEDGYNALRHRVIREFKESATLKNTLFSLAALWLLHDAFDYDLPHCFDSELFGETKDKQSVEKQLLEVSQMSKLHSTS